MEVISLWPTPSLIAMAKYERVAKVVMKAVRMWNKRFC